MPPDLKAAFVNPSVIFWFHNVFFDRNIIENVLGIVIPIQRYRCSMATALSHGLPAGLGDLGTVLGIREDRQKIKDGKRLVLKFCKPKKLKDGTLKWATPETDPEDWAKYLEYASTDVYAMRECVRKIPSWNYPYSKFERECWFMDQTVNSRGMNIDLELVNAAIEADMGPPVAGMKDIEAPVITPIGWGPQKAHDRWRHPRPRHPVVAATPRPIARGP